MTKRTFEEAQAEGRRLLPDALRIIGQRLESDDMVETQVCEQAASEIERLRKQNADMTSTLKLIEIGCHIEDQEAEWAGRVAGDCLGRHGIPEPSAPKCERQGR